MKPETFEKWELALTYFRRAEQLFRDKKFHEAEGHAITAVILAAQAMIALSKELQMPGLSEIGLNAIGEFVDRSKKHYTPEATIEWSRRVIKRLGDEVPPDTFLPLRD